MVILVNKKYYTISEVSKKLDIKAHVIRYWDSKFEGISTRLNDNKQRFFNNSNIKKIKDLKLTLYKNGKLNYPLELANKLIDVKNTQFLNSHNESSFNINSKIDINDLIKIRENLINLI